jgi:hypothetical protein
MTPLHWAAVKGSKACIKHLIEAGADLNVKEGQGKTPRDMAEELKGVVPFTKGLEEAGRTELGTPILSRFGEVSSFVILFGNGGELMNSAIQRLYYSYCQLSLSGSSSNCSHGCRYIQVYHSSWLSSGSHNWSVCLSTCLSKADWQLVTKHLLVHRPEEDRVTGSPYFSAIIVASLIWVTYSWATRLLRGTPGYLATNTIYILSAVACAYNLYKGITTDPGFVPKSISDTEIKMVCS